MSIDELIFNNMLKLAKDLLELDSSNINYEYLRGICELIAELYPIEDIDTGDRAVQIAVLIGLSEEVASLMYDR